MNSWSHKTVLYKFILVEVEQTIITNLLYGKESQTNFKISNYTKLNGYDSVIIVLKSNAVHIIQNLSLFVCI